jgi:hypothetical protein
MVLFDGNGMPELISEEADSPWRAFQNYEGG